MKNKTFISFPDLNFTALNKLKINLKNVNPTHLLDKYPGVKYKFGAFSYNPDVTKYGIDYDWKKTLFRMLNLEFKEGVSYSLAVLATYVLENKQIKYVTCGKHLPMPQKGKQKHF